MSGPRLTIISTFAVIALLLVTWKFGGSWFNRSSASRDPLEPGTPVMTLHFDDGYELEVFGLAQDEWLDGIMEAPARFSISKSGSSTYAYGNEKDYYQIESFTLNDQLAGIRTYLTNGDPLYLSVRLRKPNGWPVPPHMLSTQDLSIRIADTKGGEIIGHGPHGHDDDPHGRGVVAFHAWPRSGTDLTFTAHRREQKPLTFKFTNPVAGVIAKTWKTEPMPQVRTDPDWKAELVEVVVEELPGGGTLLRPVVDFNTTIPASSTGWQAIAGGEDFIAGALGSQSYLKRFPTANQGESIGYQIAPDETLFKFTYAVQYDASYPRDRSKTSFIASGQVSSDGKSIPISSKTLGFGLTELEVGPIEPNEHRISDGKVQFDVSFKGKWDKHLPRATAERTLGVWDDWELVVFTDRTTKSAGRTEWSGKGSGSFVGGESFYWQGHWTGDLKPGMSVEFGLIPRNSDDLLEFVFDRSQLTPKK